MVSGDWSMAAQAFESAPVAQLLIVAGLGDIAEALVESASTGGGGRHELTSALRSPDLEYVHQRTVDPRAAKVRKYEELIDPSCVTASVECRVARAGYVSNQRRILFCDRSKRQGG